jgi:15,16-dihydrobiliverdin:ferredoxin oxidoreductase
MKAQYLFLVVSTVMVVADAYVRSSFIGRPVVPSSPFSMYAFSPSSRSSSCWRMDMERDSIDYTARYNLEQLLHQSQPPTMSLDQAEAVHSMPWKASIDPSVDDDELLYMPFWEWTMSFMKENLTNLRVLPCTNGKTDFSYNENTKKQARIVNLCASSAEYRKIRMTYYDAGDNTQVFNAVFYPDPKYNLPVLGIDLLAFNRKKYLAIVDFQPLHEKEEDHATTYEHILAPIKEQYDTLKGRMSSKFYDETKFFSQQMLFARFEDEAVVARDLFPAFQSYMETHLKLIREASPKPSDVDFVLKRQKEYDTYSAERDPATGLFTAMFGGEWAMDFVHDFLFSMSERKQGAVLPTMPCMGGPPQQQQQKAQQQQGATTPGGSRKAEPVAVRRR